MGDVAVNLTSGGNPRDMWLPALCLTTCGGASSPRVTRHENPDGQSGLYMVQR